MCIAELGHLGSRAPLRGAAPAAGGRCAPVLAGATGIGTSRARSTAQSDKAGEGRTSAWLTRQTPPIDSCAHAPLETALTVRRFGRAARPTFDEGALPQLVIRASRLPVPADTCYRSRVPSGGRPYARRTRVAPAIQASIVSRYTSGTHANAKRRLTLDNVARRLPRSAAVSADGRPSAGQA